MAKIMNIGALDVRNIDENLAQKVTEIANIGVLIESDTSQVLLKDASKMNIGSTVKVERNVDVKIIVQNGKMEIDRDYFEGLLSPVIILLNGSLTIDNDIDVKLFDEKVYSIIVNGELNCPKKLVGVIQSKGIVNGRFFKYNSDYGFFDNNVNLTNKFLRSLNSDSKLAFKQLFLIEKVDMNLFKERISNIQILDKLILIDGVEDEISKYIDKYYAVDKFIVPKEVKNLKYADDDISINNSSIKKYNHAFLYVDGNVEVFLKDSLTFSEYIEYLICDKIICNKETYEIIKDNVDEGVEVEIIEGKLLENSGKMILSDTLEEVTIRNEGKLILDEKLNYEKFNENVIDIINYGLIEVPEDKISIVKNKVKKNYGKIRTKEEMEVKDDETDEEILYANVGELKL